MAYTIKKAPHIQDEVVIQDGEKKLTLTVNIYVDDIMTEVDATRAQLAQAQARIQELRRASAGENEIAAAYLELSRAAVSLFRLVFGPEQTELLVEFYDDRVAAALADLVPYLTEVILPAIKTAQADLAKRYTAWNR